MNRKLLLLVFLVVSDCSPLPFQRIFLRKVFGRKQQISWIHVCRAWSRGRQLPQTVIIERSKDFVLTNVKSAYLPANPVHAAVFFVACVRIC